MARVEWSRYSGEDIEDVVAMFVTSDFPYSAEHVTPSRGDGGIDILVRDGQVRVYQVKRFSRSLTSAQKKQVKDSVDALVTDPRVNNLRVDEYHVVMPWDPTLEEKAWLTDYVTSKGLPEPVWHGLAQCDAWASKYPYIVDYYFRGGEARIREAASGLLHGLRLKELERASADDVNVDRIARSLQGTVEFLNAEDPFYTYGVSVGPSRDRKPRDLVEAVMATQPGLVYSEEVSAKKFAMRVDVYAKTRMSTTLCPISVQSTIRVAVGSPEEAAIRQFQKFGSPLTLPGGSVDATIDAPSGLGGAVTGAALHIIPGGGFADAASHLRLVLRDSGGGEIVSLLLRREYLTQGVVNDELIQGVETQFVDDATGILTVTLRHDFEARSDTISATIRIPSGLFAGDVVPALTAFRALRAPNTFTLAPRFGPVSPDCTPLPDRNGEDDRGSRLWLDIAKSLSLIQEHTSLSLRFPERIESVEIEFLVAIVRTGALLAGRVFEVEIAEVTTSPRVGAFGHEGPVHVAVPWAIDLPEGHVDLGYLIYQFNSSVMQRRSDPVSGEVDVWKVDGGKVLVRSPLPGELDDPDSRD